ncbi:MAG: hypothetical protein RIM99_03370 [Cyclobacteriaceae bacterium]
MLVPIDQMPETSRVWIYQADRRLSLDESSFVEKAGTDFLAGWTAHGHPLKASFSLEYDQFLLITVDEEEAQASGCSIDSSVHLIRELEERLQLSFTDHGNVAFLIDQEVTLLPFNKVKEKVTANEILPETKVFDNTVKNLGEFRSKWLTTSEKTWISRFFN